MLLICCGQDSVSQLQRRGALSYSDTGLISGSLGFTVSTGSKVRRVAYVSFYQSR